MNMSEWEAQLNEQIPRLRRYARALTQNVTNADDLVQDCLERAWDRRGSWRPESNLRAWLFTIMHNLFVNEYHRLKRESAIMLPINEHDSPGSGDNSDLLRDLASCLAKLKPEFREVVVLVGLENLSYKEVAEIVSAPIGTVMSRLSRGREELRQLMSGQVEPKLKLVK